MTDTPESCRDLVYAIMDHRRRDLPTDVLLPWVEASDAPRWLAEFGARSGDPVPRATVDERIELYALSRVNDLLTFAFQPYADISRDPWPGPRLTGDDYLAFMRRLGFTPTTWPAFAPFFHEIVHVDPAPDPASPPVVIKTLWPAMMLGPMLFSRAGVIVHAGADHLRKKLAETSRLHWAWRRRNRPVTDPSVGWGSNSQWGTLFRRDYHFPGEFHFSVDGRLKAGDAPSPGAWDGDLPEPLRTELVTHRCLVRTDIPDDDLYPYNIRLTTTDGKS